MVRVLIVEDSCTQATEIRFRLEDAGFGAEVAADGVEALAALDRQGFDVVVADLRMPRMDGLELVEAVRRDHPSIPVVLVTAHGSEEVAARALRAGAAGYVPKANLDRDLAATLADVLALRGSDPDLARVVACMDEACLRFTLGNDPALVPALVGRIEDLVAAMGLCDRTGSLRVAVALHEALVNAIDHGNLELDSALRQVDERAYRLAGDERRGRPPYCNRRVHFEARVTPAEAAFRIRDEGPGFDPAALPDPADPANLERIGGRGLTLIRAFMDGVCHNAAGNEVVLVKRADRCEPCRPVGIARRALPV